MSARWEHAEGGMRTSASGEYIVVSLSSLGGGQSVAIEKRRMAIPEVYRHTLNILARDVQTLLDPYLA